MKCPENSNAKENSHVQELTKLLKLLGSVDPIQSAYTRTETEILIDTVKNSALLIALALLSTRTGKEARDV